MIYVLTCECGGVENMARAILRDAGVRDWLNVPIYKGKSKAREILSNPEISGIFAVQALLKYINETSAYAVVLGIDKIKNVAIWADAKRGKIQSRLDAQIIAENYF